MKTDTLFYQLFQQFPWIFFQLIDSQQSDIEAYQFIAPEVKQRAFRLDGLFVTTEDRADLPLYFVEVQFYKEDDFYDRIIPSIFLFFSQFKPINSDWYVIVIFDKESNDVTVPERYEEVANRRLRKVYLNQIADSEETELGIGTLRLIVETQSLAPSLAKSLIDKAKDSITDATVSSQLVELIETIIIYKFPQLTLEEVKRMLNIEGIKQTRVYQDAKAEGIEQGKAEGRLQQKIETIPLLQELGLNIEQIAQRLEISEDLVRENIREQN